AANCPQCVAKMLLQQWYFCLHCKLDILQVCLLTTIGRDSREHPGTAFLIHYFPSAIDWIDNHAPDSFVFCCTARQNQLPILDTFSYENQRRNACQLLLKQFDKQFFTDAVNRVDCVALGCIVRNSGELFELRALAFGDDGIAHSLVNTANWTEQVTYVAHDCTCL